MSLFDIEAYLANDVRSINNAYEMANISHKAKNIPTAGDTVERYIREFIKKRIPGRYYTTQGHVVDQALASSGQFDILIADDKGSPTLASYANGTEFLAYESIYAIGEIKSTYSTKGKEPVREFIEKVKHVNEQLKREEVDVFQTSQDYKRYGNNLFKDERTEDGWLYKNPIFKFMFFVKSNGMKLEKVIEIIDSYDRKHQPNIICLLDRGLIVNRFFRQSVELETGISLENYPEFMRDEFSHKWQLLEFENIGAATLAYLVYALNFHMSRCIVSRADLMKYHNELFKVSKIYPKS